MTIKAVQILANRVAYLIHLCHKLLEKDSLMTITLAQWETEEALLIDQFRAQGIVNSDAQAMAEAQMIIKYNTTWEKLYKENN